MQLLLCAVAALAIILASVQASPTYGPESGALAAEKRESFAVTEATSEDLALIARGYTCAGVSPNYFITADKRAVECPPKDKVRDIAALGKRGYTCAGVSPNYLITADKRAVAGPPKASEEEVEVTE